MEQHVLRLGICNCATRYHGAFSARPIQLDPFGVRFIVAETVIDPSIRTRNAMNCDVFLDHHIHGHRLHYFAIWRCRVQWAATEMRHTRTRTLWGKRKQAGSTSITRCQRFAPLASTALDEVRALLLAMDEGVFREWLFAAALH